MHVTDQTEVISVSHKDRGMIRVGRLGQQRVRVTTPALLVVDKKRCPASNLREA